MENRKLYCGMTPYRFSFIAEGTRHSWIRFSRNGMEAALAAAKLVAHREYPATPIHAFLIESDQDDEIIRKSWGLPY